ncbi:bifunctional 4-hydroxy-2-oxoglutarate aldolase/2-dehydro-3-deoxy-phosphogluconate aldolase [Kribbella flavida]|uniref:bifunctional 4-hydroxy-2-oxoglutarate aldolase/2-dehydro-3-deoxy-phosphogluconate aldolase n=1 Tax=Kribbella flavida TaxID=182640 RepID=UPI001ED90F03|nr:bifunctional 4-hydroxy-2-oxoglutarate aldolase/2-dehydro-3-deoxy-phosphogluconate aldolase [Kribbella flavida]
MGELSQRRLLAIVRADGAETAIACARVLVEAGVTALEVSLTTPGGVDAIGRLRGEFGDDVLLGAGTVMTASQADAVLEAGAAFAVTPAITRGALRSVEIGLPLACGALTPSEIVAAVDLGAAAVKIFPAGVHGPSYFKELRGPLPDVRLVAVGGVTADSAPEYLRAGAVAVGVGSPLLGDAAKGGDLLQLKSRAQQFLEAVAG